MQEDFGLQDHDGVGQSFVRCKVAERFAVDFGQLPKFSNINHSFARFAFVHVGMRHSHPQRHIPLSQASLPPSRDEPLQHTIIVVAQLGIPALS